MKVSYRLPDFWLMKILNLVDLALFSGDRDFLRFGYSRTTRIASRELLLGI